MPVAEMIEQFKEIQHPRVPIFRVHRDNLVGFLHAEDVLRLMRSEQDLSALTVEDIMRPPVVAPPTKKVDEMFDFFQANNARAAAVLNEFGGVEGFLTMQDVLKFIFGHTSGVVVGQELYRERDENVYEVPGDMKLTDFNNLTNFGIEDPRMTTIGGVAFRHLDRLPHEGDTVHVDDIAIIVLEMKEHRISQVRVARGQAETAAEESAPSPDEATSDDGSPTEDATAATEVDDDSPATIEPAGPSMQLEPVEPASPTRVDKAAKHAAQR